MMRRQLWIAAVLAGAAGLTLAQTQDQAEKLFESLYGKRIAAVRRTTTTQDDLALVKQMLEAVTIVKAEPDMVSLLCERACDLAVSARDCELAITAIETLRKHCPRLQPFCDRKTLAVYERLYLRSGRQAKRSIAMKLVPRYLAQSARHADAGDHSAAIASTRKALDIAVAQRLRTRGEIQDRILLLTNHRRLLDLVRAMKEKELQCL